MIILGIETSCDETAVALIETRGNGATFECRVIDSIIHSQANLHSTYGGVYPAIAKREHSKYLFPLLQKILAHLPYSKNLLLPQETWTEKVATFRNEIEPQNPDLFEAFIKADFLQHIPNIDYIAITEGPGLEPALWVGIACTRILASLWNIPVIPVNHMEGHIVGSLLSSDKPHGEWQKLKEVSYPALALLISGGHTELVSIKKQGDYEIIGQTKDDAVGEAFDKAARLLDLPYPGGPQIAKLAQEACDLEIKSSVTLPRPMIGSADLNFSFSGLKTAVLYAVRKAETEDRNDIAFRQGLAREFEEAVKDTFVSKIKAAINTTDVQSVIIGGGVSANTYIIEAISKELQSYSLPLFLPSRHISGDNALMIALAAALNPTTKTPGSLRAHGTKKLGFAN